MTTVADVGIIGSGVSGIACAKALISRGVRVTMLDVGETLPPHRQAVIDTMRHADPSLWDPAHVRLIRENRTVTTHAIPRKLAFGSDYVYGEGRPFAPIEGDVTDVSFSFAKGGFSNVWGGAMLAAADHDMSDWPIRRSDLEPYYEKLLADIPLSAGHDSLATVFPLYRATVDPIPLGRQTKSLLARFRGSEDKLRSLGIVAGAARVAVQAKPSLRTPGCNGCGLCLTGCPRGAIYSTVPDLEALSRSGYLRYESGVVAAEISESATGVYVVATNPECTTVRRFAFQRLFVAAGPINTARLIMNSLKLFGQPLVMLESQKFLLPFLHPPGNPHVFDETTFSLPNALVVVRSPGSAGHWAQVQVSPTNDLVLQKLRLWPDSMARPVRWALAHVLGRLMFGWGSIHSDHSSHLRVELRHGNQQHLPTLRLEPVENPEFRAAVARIVRRLLRGSCHLGLIPLAPLMRVSAAGTGSHYGGIFPMRANPRKPWDVDVLGRPAGFTRLHVVDSAVFPSVPGTTIALLSMANAMRIASQAPLGD